MFEKIFQWMQKLTAISPNVLEKIVVSAVVIFVLWLIHLIAGRLIDKNISDLKIRYRTRKTSDITTVIIGTILVGRVWSAGFGSIITFVGLVSAGLVVALKDLAMALTGWIFVIWRRQFSLGDRIQIGPHAGDVIDIGVFKFTMMEIHIQENLGQSTGRIIHVPNGQILTEPIINATRGFKYIWDEIPINLTFDSNWQRAKLILSQIVERYSAKVDPKYAQQVQQGRGDFMIHYKHLTPTIYTNADENGIILTIRYLCEPRRRRISQQAIWEDLLRAFDKRDDIRFAHKAQRLKIENADLSK